MVSLFTTFVFDPLYNTLVALISVVPGADVGIAVILLTLLVKLLLSPLALQASTMQRKVRQITPEIDELKEKYKDDQQEQTLKMLALYKEHNIRPFTSILVVLIQLPIIFGLYWVFFRGGLPVIDVERLYSFVSEPSLVNMNFIGLIDMGGRSILLALLAGATQYIQGKITIPAPTPPKNADEPTLKDDLARSFHLQIRYVLPVIVTVIAYTISSAIALYWLVSNLFTIAQEYYIRRGDTTTSTN